MSDEKGNGTSRSRRRAARAAAQGRADEPTIVSPAIAVLSGEAEAAWERLAADVRALVALARSAALPSARRVDEAERTAAQHLAELRAGCLPRSVPLPTVEPGLDSAWREPDHGHPDAESSPA
jgi:hypothetical protein